MFNIICMSAPPAHAPYPSRQTLSDIYPSIYLSIYPSVYMISVSPNALCGQVRPALMHSKRVIACTLSVL